MMMRSAEVNVPRDFNIPFRVVFIINLDIKFTTAR